MSTVPIDTALAGLIAVAYLAFCLGFVSSTVLNMRTSRAVQAAPRTDPTITATGRKGRWEAADEQARVTELASSQTAALRQQRYQMHPRTDRVVLVDEDDAYPKALCACGYLRCLCDGGPR